MARGSRAQSLDTLRSQGNIIDPERDINDNSASHRTLVQHIAYSDALMSDIPDMSEVTPSIKHTTFLRDDVPDSPTHGPPLPKKLFSRPDTATDDMPLEFLIPKSKLLQRNRIHRTSPPGSIHYVQPSHTICTTTRAPESAEGLAKTNVAKLRPHAATNENPEIDFCVIPINRVLHTPKSIHIGQDNPPSKATADEELQMHGSYTSGNGADASSQNEPSTSTVLEDHEEDGTQDLEQGTDPTDNDGAAGQLPGSQTTDVVCSLTQNATASSLGIQTPRPMSYRTTTPVRNDCEKSPLQTLIDGTHRVRKLKVVPGRVQAQEQIHEAQVVSMARSQKKPSEADLLYLLMHHARQRDQNAARKLQRQDQLEDQNTGLREAQALLKEELEDVVAERDEMLRKAEEAHNELDSFRTKYKKLKAWALEMNNEYAAIRQEGSELKASCAILRQQSSDIRNPAQASLKSTCAALATVASVKENIKDAQQTVQALETKLQKAHNTIAEKCGELRTLKLAEKVHKAHVLKLFTMYEAFKERTNSDQCVVTKTLSTLAQKIDSFAEQPKKSNDLDECLRLVKEIAGSDAATSKAMTGVDNTIASFTEQLRCFQQGVEKTLQARQEPCTSGSLVDDISSLKETIENLRPDILKVQELQQTNARFQERTNGDAAIRKLVEEAKHLAEIRQAEVQKNNNKLIDSITLIRDNEEQQRSRTANNAETQLSVVMMKWTVASKELEETKVKIRSYENDVANLRRQLEDCEEYYVSEGYKTKAQHEKDIQNLKVESTMEVKVHFAKEIQKRDELVATSKAALQDIQEMLDATKQECKQANASKGVLDERLRLAQHEVLLIKADLENQNQLYAKLTEELNEVSGIASTVPALKQVNVDRDQIIASLQADIIKLEECRKVLEVTSARCVAKDQSIVELSEKLQEANKDRRTKDELEGQVIHYQRELKSHQDRLTEFEKKIAVLNELKEGIKRKDVDINRVHNLLEDAQNACNKLQGADKRKDELQKQVHDLQQELSFATQRASQVPVLEDLNGQKDDAIATLEKQVSHITQLQTDLDAMRVQLNDKEEQITIQGNKIDELKAQHVTQNLARTLALDDSIDELFTQNTNLSIDSHVWQDTKAVSNLPTQISVRSIGSIEACAKSLSQPSIIPDSQLDPHAEQYDSLRAEPAESGRSQRTSSPLSEIIEDEVDADIEVDGSNSNDARLLDKSTSQQDEESDVFDFPPASPLHPARYRVSRTLSRYPSSVASHEDMLLQSSETGRQGTLLISTAQHAHPTGKSAISRASVPRPQGDRSVLQEPSPRRLRRDTSSQMAAGNGVSSISNSRSNRGISREPNRPNSAIKRRVDETDADVNDRLGGKRLKLSTGRSEARTNGRAQQNSTTSVAVRSVDDLPAGSRSGNAPGEGKSTTKKFGKRSKASRKLSMQDRYAAQFSSSSQS